MRKIAFCLALAIGTTYTSHVLAGKNDGKLMEQAQSQFKPIPTEPPALEGNEVTPERIELGKWLYFDPRLSKSWLISCNTCHNLALGGVDLEETSIGHGWAKGPRNAPTVLNSVFNLAQFWDGRAEDLEAQAKGPIQAGVEMNNTPDRVERTLKSIPEYVQSFRKAFPGEADPVSFNNMAKAIEAFEATLLTPGSPFDKYLKGDAGALSKAEKRGLKLFMDKGCSSCHSGVNLGGEGYYPFGVVEKPGGEVLPEEDKGRFAVTKTASDEYVFKVPSLRNIELTPPYFHSGEVWELEQAVAIMGSSQLGIDLNDNETAAIVTFLKTLTGEQPKVEYPILPPHTKGTPLPVVDVSSEAMMGH
ncbi:Cytochrome-c peroxidase [Nitrosococcus halophilus Nc 4]|uniref:Cytochrome-c peroxidase n=1 Tax=Nitrosococcus halophilus (strain Nc4) TaxID=472759 RepID=D5BXN9_NITHN|nr:cytochrome-c peroxidase [Nitrosococcus halophilus]ADE13997.1 Cytochrome-c peroxidase [Nitrosococcus halophilus Nc 4]